MSPPITISWRFISRFLVRKIFSLRSVTRSSRLRTFSSFCSSAVCEGAADRKTHVSSDLHHLLEVHQPVVGAEDLLLEVGDPLLQAADLQLVLLLGRLRGRRRHRGRCGGGRLGGDGEWLDREQQSGGAEESHHVHPHSPATSQGIHGARQSLYHPGGEASAR